MRIMILLAALAAFLPLSVHAACLDEADALASKFGVSAGPAQVGGSSAATSEALAATGGVIAPPATGDQGTIKPTLPNPDAMKTAPAIVPQTAEGGITTGKTAGVEGKAAAQTQAASLLQAAHHAGATGDEATCKQRLADARGLLEKSPTAAQ